MKNLFLLISLLALTLSNSIFPEKGTRAKTMRNQTQRTPKNPPSTPSTTTPYRPPANNSPSPRYQPSSEAAPKYQPSSAESENAKDEPNTNDTITEETCAGCKSENTATKTEEVLGVESLTRDFLLNSISINSKVALTNWDFHFSPAIQYQSKFLPTYELDLNILGFQFSYLTTRPFQSSGVFREIPIIDEKNALRNSLIESMGLSGYPLTFMKHPLMRNLLAMEFRKTTKAAVVRAGQNLYYFPATSHSGLTEQDSDLGTIFYEQKAAGTELAYSIKERDWLFTIGIYALRIGFFDINYSKPYQMDADIYQNDVLIDQRVYLFEGQATGQGIMVGLQNLFFPDWNTSRFHFSSPDHIADGFFWGVKEIGFYWGTGNIRLQNNIDLVEKYKAFYQGETGHAPSVSFLRQMFHLVIGYKFNRNCRVFAEYRYTNYSLALKDSYEDDAYNYFLNHAINRDTFQQFAINFTAGF